MYRTITPLTDEEIVRETVRIINECAGGDVEIFLVGSRARKDHRPNSDFDFAISIGSRIPLEVIAHMRALVDDLDTLHKIDIVDLHSAGDAFKGIAMKHSVRLR